MKLKFLRGQFPSLQPLLERQSVLLHVWQSKLSRLLPPTTHTQLLRLFTLEESCSHTYFQHLGRELVNSC